MEIIKITFENHGQDFLSFKLDKELTILSCEPFNSYSWLWIGKSVVSSKSQMLMEVGDKILAYDDNDPLIVEIPYPIKTVERMEL